MTHPRTVVPAHLKGIERALYARQNKIVSGAPARAVRLKIARAMQQQLDCGQYNPVNVATGKAPHEFGRLPNKRRKQQEDAPPDAVVKEKVPPPAMPDVVKEEMPPPAMPPGAVVKEEMPPPAMPPDAVVKEEAALPVLPGWSSRRTKRARAPTQ